MANDYADDFELYGDDFEEDDDMGARAYRASSRAAPVSAAAGAPAGRSTLDVYYERLRTGVVRLGTTQTPEGRAEMSTQCEPVSVSAASLQVPEDLALSAAAATSAAPTAGLHALSAQALRFIRTAGAAIERLCEEGIAARDTAPPLGATLLRAPSRPAKLRQLPTAGLEALLSGRPVLCGTASSARSSGDIVVALGRAADSAAGAGAAGVAGAGVDGVDIDRRVRSASLIIVYQATAEAPAGPGSQPPAVHEEALRYVLLCWGVPTCLLVSPDGSAVFAGTLDGSVHVWDLTEPAWMHHSVFGTRRVAAAAATAAGPGATLVIKSGLRPPSYSTHATRGSGGEEGSGSSGSGSPSAWWQQHAGGKAADSSAAASAGPSVFGAAGNAAIRCILPLQRPPLPLPSAGVGGASAAADAAEAGADNGAAAPGGTRNRGLASVGAGFASLLQGADGSRADASGKATGAPVGGTDAAATPLQVLCVDDCGRAETWVVLRVAAVASQSAGASIGGGAAGVRGAAPAGASLEDSSDAAGGDGPAAVSAGSAGGAAATGASSSSLRGLIDQTDFGRAVTSGVKLIRASAYDASLARGSAAAAGGPGSSAGSAGSRAGSAAGSRMTPRAGAAGDASAGGAAAASSLRGLGPMVFAADVCPTDSSRLLLACSDGIVRHVSRSGGDPSPAQLLPPGLGGADVGAPLPEEGEAGVLSGGAGSGGTAPSATAVAYHPLHAAYALVGYDNGSVALFHTAHPQPAHVWTSPWSGYGARAATSGGTPPQQQRPAPVARLLWLPSRPCAFVAVDESAFASVWDLSVSASAPVHSTALSASWSAAAAAGGASRSGAGGPGARVVSAELVGGTLLAPRALSLVCTFESGASVLLPFERQFLVPRAAEARAAADVLRRVT